MNLSSPQVQAGIKKHGSVEAYREFMREQQKKSRQNYSGNGGFRGISVEKRKEISRLGVLSRAKKKAASEQDAAQSKKEPNS